jgi:predicted ATPase/DNA-binding winged helix-turn-helix (wHTH) protein
MLYRFADCELDPERAVLRRAHTSLKLQRRVFEVLLYLLEHRGHMVSKDDLAAQVWQAAITNTTIDACIREVRRAVGDSGQAQRIIATRHGFGYEFVAPVEVAAQAEAEVAEQPEAAEPVPGHAPESGAEALEAAPPAGAPPRAPATPQAPPGEKKVVTVLCCGVQIVPRSSAEADLDGLHSQMRALYDLVQHEVSRYGGTVQPLTGQRFLAWFGAPVAQEDHAQRALLAALGVHQRLSTPAALPQSLRAAGLAVQSGLHTGEVAIGGVAEAQALAAVVMGETALLATALQAAAAAGSLLCSAATARLVQGLVAVEPLPPLVLADWPTPVAVGTVRPREGGRLADAPLRRRPLRQFVGRQQELAALRQGVEQVTAGRGQVVGMAGEPGIGKSRLLAEFHTRLRPHAVTYLEGRCVSYGQETPYRPVLDLLRQACGLNEMAPPDLIDRQVTRTLQALGLAPDAEAPYLLHLLGVPAGTARLPSLSPEELKARIYTTFWRLLRHMSQRHPLVLAIEDLHWIDATSEAMLTALVEHLADVPMLLVATYRAGYHPPWLDKSYATQLSLQPLTSRESHRLLQAVFSTVDVPDSLVQQLIEQAEGNPFFLEELAWTAMEHGVSRPLEVVPETVQAVLMARMDRLPPAEKHLLQIAAVIGKDVPVDVLEAVAEQPVAVVHKELERLQHTEFLYESRLVPVPIYTFKHALTQEVAYHALLRSTRQPYHQRIAQVLAEQFPDTAALYPEVVAHHYTEAGLGEQALPYWQQAGQRAIERSANAEAISHLTKGLEVLETLPETPERVQHELTLCLTLGPALLMIKGHGSPEVEAIYSRAYTLCQRIGESPQRFSALAGLWRFYFTRARFRMARELAEQCFTLAQGRQEPVLLQEVQQMLGSTLLFVGEFLSAREHLELGITLYDPLRSRTRTLVNATDPGVVCLARAAWALWLLGYPTQALRRMQEALALAQELSHPYSLGFALNYATVLHGWRREIPLVQERAVALLSLASEQGFVQWSNAGMVMQGWALIEQGAIQEGMEQFQQALGTAQTTSYEVARTQRLARLADAYGKCGQAEAGLRVLAEALAMVHHHGDHYYEAELYRLKGVSFLLRAVPTEQEAEADFRQALDVARQQHAKAWELRAAMSLSRLLQNQGKRAAAHQLLASIYDWFTEGFDTADLQEAKALLDALR